MKHYSRRHTTLAFFLVVLSLQWGDSAKETKERENQFRVFHRLRRQLTCQDGTYTADGKTCCLCAAGQRLSKPCNEAGYRECEPCYQGKNYNSEPNSDSFCEPCRSCEHPNANVEEKEKCTIAKNAVCQCSKKDYYCNNENCTLCNPCETCDEGKMIKEPCTGTANTICGEKAIGPSTITTIILAVLLPLLLLLLLALAVVFCIRKRGRMTHEQELHQVPEIDPNQIPDGNLLPHVPQIAPLLTFTVMRDIALADGILKATIENHQENHRNNAQEQVIHVLMDWTEMMGRKAPRELLRRLRDKKMNDTFEKVLTIIQTEEQSAA